MYKNLLELFLCCMFAVSITNKKTNIMNLAQKIVTIVLTGLGIFLTINQVINDFSFVL